MNNDDLSDSERAEMEEWFDNLPMFSKEELDEMERLSQIGNRVYGKTPWEI